MTTDPALGADVVRRAPKVVLHDHLDGGLRPGTVIELAEQQGYVLPTTDPAKLAVWFTRGADSKSLPAYLEAFAHTCGVMQTEQALHRVAVECVEDLAADGVVYAEVRFAPELHTRRGLPAEAVVEAVLDGIRSAARTHGATAGVLLTAMRTADNARQTAELAVRYRDQGVVGFDIAGAEAGYPPTRHIDAFRLVAREYLHVTIHAGESFGLPSIREAVTECGAERLGHGVRITDDIDLDPDGGARLGRLAGYVRDRRIALELCPTSNVHTGAVAALCDHPIDLLRRLGFRVTLNTDNRLMSAVSMTSELMALNDCFGWGLDEMEQVAVNSLKSAFAPYDERVRLIRDVVVPAYSALRSQPPS